jgi:hypothetical protein
VARLDARTVLSITPGTMARKQYIGTARLTAAPIALQFINTAHPSDATSKDSLSRIRSHAAKKKPLRLRKRRRPVIQTIDGNEMARLETPEKSDCHQQDTAPDGYTTSLGVDQNNAKVTTTPPITWPPSSPQINGLARLVPFRSSARSFSDREYFLLDHCKPVITMSP